MEMFLIPSPFLQWARDSRTAEFLFSNIKVTVSYDILEIFSYVGTVPFFTKAVIHIYSPSSAYYHYRYRKHTRRFYHMENNDTINLLKECDSGTKMAVASIDEVLEKTKASDMRKLLRKSRDHHEQLGNEIHELLLRHHSEEKEPGLMAKGMSWFKTNIKMSMDDSDASIAELMTDGCDMGIKTLYQRLSQYPAADQTAKGLCRKLISIEEEFRSALHSYL